MKGRVHSLDSFGTVDGPGIRLVVFLQGCPMRCLYCHNPDTWTTRGGVETEALDIIREYEKNRAFYSKGGITVTGGEPLMQPEFVAELFALAHERGIHTTLDTSGITFNESNAEALSRLDRVLDNTDLVMLDIKHIDPEKHLALTGKDNENVLAFAKHLAKRRIPLWVRHVVIEGYTDGEEDLRRRGEFIGGLSSLKALDVLPYHTLGIGKYRELGIPYPLEGIEPLTSEKALLAKARIMEGIRSSRAKLVPKKK